MPSFVSLMDTVLTGGAWSSYGSQPDIFGLNLENKRKNPYLGIILQNQPSRVEQAVDCSIVFTAYAGRLEIYARNITDRDNIESDVKDAIEGSSYSIRIVSIEHARRRNRWQTIMRLELVD